MLRGVLMNGTGQTFCPQLAQVRVHVTTHEGRVVGLCEGYGCQRIMNPMTARSQPQLAGAVVWGLGQALIEESVEDVRSGQLATRDLADHHFPVQYDVLNIKFILLDEHDERITPLGIKCVDEIGVIGVAAAIAKPVYNATGIRARELPITPNKMIAKPLLGD